MSLYPSLEDMMVDQMAQAQQSMAAPPPSTSQPSQVAALLPYPSAPTSAYPGLAEYMGLELTEDIIRANMPEYLPSNQQNAVAVPTIRGGTGVNMIAPISANNPGLVKAQVSHGVRQVVLCKDQNGKIGLKAKAVNKGVFVCLVAKQSPAALGGLRFGDQILQINGENVAGFSSDKVHDILKNKTSVNNINLVIRDRPFERTLTLHKDSTGHIGFQFKEGKITAIGVDTSAARNGLLIDHNLLEVNGQNVVGIKDKEIGTIIEQGGEIITVTIIPTVVYNHIMKNMSSSVIKKLMDHSIPEV